MNLLFRLFFIVFAARFRRSVPVIGPCRTSFRCWLTDLDVLRHMNNGKYFSLLDLARVDLMARAGLWRQLGQKGWYPVVVAETMRFRKSIQLFEAFEVETKVIGWDEKAFLVRHEFVRKGTVLAEAVIRARFLKKAGGTVAPQDILQLAGWTQGSPTLDPWVAAWNARHV